MNMSIEEYKNKREAIREGLRNLPAHMLLSEYMIVRDNANKSPDSVLRSMVFADYHSEILSRLSAYDEFIQAARKWGA